MASLAVPCAVGTYYDEETRQCVSCPVGTYQSESGQLKCSSCPVIAGRPSVTVGPGARSAADCKERCPAGKYYDDVAGLCRSCGHGFYQPSEGSFSCLLCGLGKTTRTAEAVSREECRDECGSGQQLAVEGKCEPCPRGTYRTQGVQASCQACPLGRTTPNMGSAAIEECSLPVCEPGTYLNGTLNECVQCKKGMYQSEPQQTFCIPCPPNTSTKGPAAVSFTERFIDMVLQQSYVHVILRVPRSATRCFCFIKKMPAYRRSRLVENALRFLPQRTVAAL